MSKKPTEASLNFAQAAEASRPDEWKAVEQACVRLRAAGFEALLAGGCVRDFLLGRVAHDFDIATRATPDEIEALFPEALGIGKAFGVMILPFPNFQIEIATFRIDGAYHDGRRPEGVIFSSAAEDAKRRDFTINALFYDLSTTRVIDYVEGQKDLAARLIRAVGEPERRFEEDQLRLLRAVRFAAQLEFEIERETYRAICKGAAKVASVSRERVRDELEKLLAARGRVEGLRLFNETGLLAALFPALAKAVALDVEAWLRPFTREASDSLSLALSFFFAPADETKTLRLSRATTDAVQFIWRTQEVWRRPREKRAGEVRQLLADPQAADAREYARVVNGADDAYVDIFEKGPLPTAFLSGGDATAAGLTPGPTLGRALKEAYLLQLEGSLKTREAALAWLKAFSGA